MDGRFDVTRGGLTLGVAELSENGLLLDVYYVGNAPDNANVYRLAAVCDGRYVILGVPVPDKSGALILKKSLSKAKKCELGFEAPTAFELVLPGENYSDAYSEKTTAPKTITEKNIPPEPQKFTEMPVPIVEPVNLDSKLDAAEPVNKLPESALANVWRSVMNPSVLFTENGALSAAGDIAGALIREDSEVVYLAVPITDDAPFPLMSAFCLGEPQTINGEEYLVFKLKNGAFAV